MRDKNARALFCKTEKFSRLPTGLVFSIRIWYNKCEESVLLEFAWNAICAGGKDEQNCS